MRIFRLVATPVILLALLGLLAWAALWGWKELVAPFPSPSPTPCVVQPAAAVTPAQVTVRVFNGGFTTGLATTEGHRLTEAGFKVTKVDNTDERIKGTIIRGSEKDADQVTLVASYYKEPTVEYDDRVDGTVDVMVGSDFLGAGEAPLPEVVPESGEVCLVPSPSPTPSPSPSPAP